MQMNTSILSNPASRQIKTLGFGAWGRHKPEWPGSPWDVRGPNGDWYPGGGDGILNPYPTNDQSATGKRFNYLV